jgi:hypothetical protein
MSDHYSKNEPPSTALKSESARQRWDLFHRAIAHAKQSTASELQDAEVPASEPKRGGPLLTIIK